MDRDSRIVTAWIAVIVLGLAALNVYQYSKRAGDRDRLEAKTAEAHATSEALQETTFDLQDAQLVTEARERAFGRMGAACAQLVNRLEREAWAQGDAIGRVINGEWSAEQLREWADGEAQYQAYIGSNDGLRAACGMRVTTPPRKEFLVPTEVRPVEGDWNNGVNV